jgi:hypothetical protein
MFTLSASNKREPPRPALHIPQQGRTMKCLDSLRHNYQGHSIERIVSSDSFEIAGKVQLRRRAVFLLH